MKPMQLATASALLSTVIVVCSSFVLVAPQGTPSTCGGPSEQADTDWSPGTGVSWAGSSSNPDKAEESAEAGVMRQLGYYSGVTCDLCPWGEQCTRNITWSPGDMWTGSWETGGITYVDKEYTGGYEVNCEPCTM